MQCACQTGTRVQRSSSNTNNNNNQQEMPTRHSPTECPILPFPLSGFAAHSSSNPLIGGGKKEYARPGINGGRVLNRQLLGEFGAVIKKAGPMGRKSNAR